MRPLRAAPAEVRHAIEASLLAEQTLEITFEGHVTGALIAPIVPRIIDLRGAKGIRWVLFDTTLVTGYSLDIRAPAAVMLDTLKRSGVEKSVAVTKLASVRMMGSALTLAAGLPMRFVEFRDEAERQIEAWRFEAATAASGSKK